uniref:Uncharacterized protein n=1 Tax=Romanomermis culicivorax TaxID=13658 RepID=A0A915KTS4_ROMCU
MMYGKHGMQATKQSPQLQVSQKKATGTNFHSFQMVKLFLCGFLPSIDKTSGLQGFSQIARRLTD